MMDDRPPPSETVSPLNQQPAAKDTPEPASKSGGLDPKLLEILVCPATREPLRYDAHAGELISEKAGLAYPIRDGIPIMLIDEARRLDESDPP